jgi:hypothetical protein
MPDFNNKLKVHCGGFFCNGKTVYCAQELEEVGVDNKLLNRGTGAMEGDGGAATNLLPSAKHPHHATKPISTTRY